MQAGRNDYSAIMIMTGSITIATFKWPATAAELIVEMHKQYWIAEHKTAKKMKKKQAVTT